MPSLAGRPMLFFDFDNTITLGDVLDAVIERFSDTQQWREWERAWKEGRMSTLECLRLQMGGLRVSSRELHGFVSATPIDPAFAEIVAWAARNAVELRIVSDNFSPLIYGILERNGLSGVPVLANDLVFRADRAEPRFPFRDPACQRCAHCKAQHLRTAEGRTRIFVGDGLSDLCPASVADVVFAKDALAQELTRRGLPFLPYVSLVEVARYLHGRYGDSSAGREPLRDQHGVGAAEGE